jgi:Spy/CpxP family protein refolding chaperone
MKKALVLAVVLAISTVPAMAQQHRGGAGGGQGAPAQGFAWDGFGLGENDPGVARQALARYLELTPEQMAAWDELLATLRSTVAPLHTQIAALQEQLEQLLGEANPDPAAVGALVIQIKKLRDQVAAAHSAYVAGFEALLSPEQLAKLRLLRGFAEHPELGPACRLVGLCR